MLAFFLGFEDGAFDRLSQLADGVARGEVGGVLSWTYRQEAPWRQA